MKKVIFSIFFFSLMVVGVQAQKSTCSKSSCTAKPTAAASASCGDHKSASASTDSNAAAAKLASMDPSIESRTCPVSGTVSYVRKEKGATAGEFTYVDLAYDAKTNSFVNVSPVKMEGASGCSSKGMGANGKSCCASGTATTTSGSKSCCASKSKPASSSTNKN